jgi:hypothetical protein
VYGVYTPVFRWPGEFRFCFFETRLPDAMAKSVRSVAIELHENAKAIEAWRATLPERQRRRLVHPLSNVRRWLA